jgi:hypothetical protein
LQQGFKRRNSAALAVRTGNGNNPRRRFLPEQPAQND